MYLRIKEEMKSQGMSIGDLCERVELSRTVITNIINEKKNPSFETLLKIAGALNVPIYRLFEDSNSSAQNFTCPKCGAKLEIRIVE